LTQIEQNAIIWPFILILWVGCTIFSAQGPNNCQSCPVSEFLSCICRLLFSQGRTGPPGCLALARWADWSAGQVGRNVKCWRREWNGGSGPGAPSYGTRNLIG